MKAIEELSRSEKVLIVCVSIIIYFSFLIKGLDQGGRWDLNDQILTGIRIFQNNNIAYARGIDGPFNSVSCYPYLQSLILGFSSFFLNHRTLEFITILIFNPTIVVILFLNLLNISLNMNPILEIRIRKLYVITCSILLVISEKYKIYASEGKPDNLSLVLFLTAISFLYKKPLGKYIFNQTKIKDIFLIGSFLFLACSTKQQIIPISFLLSLYIGLASKSILKLAILNLFITASIFLPSIFMDGYFFSVFSSFAGHGLNNVLYQVYASGKYFLNILLILLIPFLISKPNLQENFSLLKKKCLTHTINTFKEFKTFKLFLKNIFARSDFLIVSIFLVYALLQTVSTFKYGGNQGNIQIGMLPILFILLPLVYETLNQKIMKFLPDKNLVSLFLVLSISILSFENFINLTKLEQNFYTRDTYFIKTLENKFDKKDLLIVDGDTMLQAIEAGYDNTANIHDAIRLSISSKKDITGGNFKKYIYSKTNNNKLFNFFVKTSLNDRIELINNPDHKFKYDYFNSMLVVEESCLKDNKFCLGKAKLFK